MPCKSSQYIEQGLSPIKVVMHIMYLHGIAFAELVAFMELKKNICDPV